MENHDSRMAVRVAGVAAIPVVVLALLYGVDVAFRALAEVELWIEGQSRLVELSEDSDRALQALVERDAVTWDPTNGSRMDRVLSLLRRGTGRRILLVGSSQLVTIRDDRRMAAYTKRVDQVLESVAPEATTVYNLAVGAMTAVEKGTVVERAAGIEAFDDVIVGVTLWDSLSRSVRPGIARLPERVERESRERFLAEALPAGPPRVNDAAAREMRAWLESHVGFFARRSAIQAWLSRGWRRTEPARSPPSAGPSAPSIEYRYSPDELRTAERNVAELVAILGAAARRHGFRAWVVVTPHRPDDRRPLYSPVEHERFVAALREACASAGVSIIDASTVLDASHFGIYEFGDLRGRIDGFHFDADGHARLARTLAAALWDETAGP